MKFKTSVALAVAAAASGLCASVLRAEDNKPAAKTVEQLAESVRKSVVIIQSAGRFFRILRRPSVRTTRAASIRFGAIFTGTPPAPVWRCTAGSF